MWYATLHDLAKMEKYMLNQTFNTVQIETPNFFFEKQDICYIYQLLLHKPL